MDPPGQEWTDFVHPTDELLMVIEGSVELTLASRTWHPEPGEEVLIPAGEKHTVRNSGTEWSKWYYGYRGV